MVGSLHWEVYCTFLSLHYSPKTADPRGPWAPFLTLRQMEICDKMVLEGNLHLCMHLLNEIVPPQVRGEVPMELDDVENRREEAF